MENYTFNLGMPRLGLPTKLLLVMKLTAILMLLGLSTVGAASFGQKVTLSERNATIKELFAKIEMQTGFGILYTDAMLSSTTPVSIKVNQANIEEALREILKDQPLDFTIENKNIILKRKEPSLLDQLGAIIQNSLVIQSAAKDLDVKGRVVDQDGKPLPNASIRVKGKSIVTSTNADGEFEIQGVDEDAVILVSYVGFKTLEIALKDAVRPLEIKLNVATGELEEVKVVYSTGYQELNKERATGSFVQIDKELLNRTPTTNILDRLANVTSGLVYNKKYEGSNKSPYQIRGLATINASDIPLIVIDGFPYEETVAATGFTGALTLKNLNPNDVESVTVLRDAAAASIWGARAGNGVIVITTKKGRFNQKSNISFTANATLVDKPNIDFLSMMSASDAIEAQTELFSRGVYNVYDDTFPITKNFPVIPEVAEILLTARRKNTVVAGYNAINDPVVKQQLTELAGNDLREDVNKYLIQKAIKQQYAINMSGGSNGYNYYGSIGYDANSGVAVGDNDNRITLRLDNSWRPIKQLQVHSNINYIQSENKPNGFNYVELLVSAPLYSSIDDREGNSQSLPYRYRNTYVDTVAFPALMDWHYYPLEELRYNNNITKGSDVRVAVDLKYIILNGLSLDAMYQYQRIMNTNRIVNHENSFFSRNEVNRFMFKTGSTISYPIQRGAIVDLNNNNQNYWNSRIKLNYNRTFALHEVAAIGGIDLSQRTTEYQNSRLYGYNEQTGLYQALINYQTSYPLKPQTSSTQILNGTSHGRNLNRLRSYYANVSYTYDSRYILSLSGRQDGANLFGVKSNQKVSPLWSAGILWNISNENFYSFEPLSMLKLRVTYGYNGNMNPTATAYPLINYANDATTGERAAYLSSPPNPYLRWEQIKIVNFALEFESKSNRFSGSLEYYLKDGIDLFGPITNDPTTGIESYTGNRFNTKGSGFDIILNSKNPLGKLYWNSTLNLSYNTNKITAYERLSPSSALVSGAGVVIGKPFNAIYSYRWAGLDPENGNPRGYLNGEIAPYAQVIGFTGSTPNTKIEELIYHGPEAPKISGNILNSMGWKGLRISFNIVYQFGHYFRRNSVAYTSLYPSSGMTGKYSGGITHQDYALRWRKKGDEVFTNVPSFPVNSDSQRDNFYRLSEILVEKADHIRLQDINLSYGLINVGRKSVFRDVQLNFMVTNLGLLWRANNYHLDPSSGIPASKGYVLGLNMSF